MPLSLTELREFASEKLKEANEGASQIRFPLFESLRKSFRDGEIKASAAIHEDPRYAALKHATGQSAWAVVLSVDLRNSTYRAEQYGARDTYLTMHTYLPTMAHLVYETGGTVIGLRGDGLFAGFGITEFVGDQKVFTPEISDKASRWSVHCGKAMIEATEDVLNPLLVKNGMTGDLKIGIGLDYGVIVITRIGLDGANEVTAYGKVVNNACKYCDGVNLVQLSRNVENIFPKEKGGTVRFKQCKRRPHIFVLDEWKDRVLR